MQAAMHSNAVAKRAERRRDPRRPASGPVHLEFESLGKVEAELMDVSASGFRVTHQRGLLQLGADALFQHCEASGSARVVWNWIYPDHVETGFVIVRLNKPRLVVA